MLQFAGPVNLNFQSLQPAAGGVVEFNGTTVTGGYLYGPGTQTILAGGATFVGTTSYTSAVINQNGPASFHSFTNGGTMNLSSGATLTGFTNQGSGSITVAAVGQVNVGDFQTYGTLTLNPAVVGSGQTTQLTNTGTSPLYFNGGSRTFIGTPQTANSNGQPTFVAGIDLHGQNAVVAGGLFVNNGYVVDSSNGGAGTATIIADYGSLVKGAGFYQNPVITQNGGRVQAGNSPGASSLGSLIIGPGGINNYGWQINDAGPSYVHPNAPGVAGPSPNANNQVSGWSELQSKMVFNPITGTTTTGNLTWTATATPGNQFTLVLETLLGPQTTVGTSPDGPMADFNAAYINYVWPIISYQGTYTGPTDSPTLTADTLIDTSLFANPTSLNPPFFLQLDTVNKQIDLLYVVVIPEPGTLALVGFAAAIGAAAYRRRRRQTRPHLPATAAPSAPTS
jgi:hypothetical protein